MSDTPMYDRLAAEFVFANLPGRVYTEDEGPPLGEPMTLENVDGDRIRWNGKRWYNPETCDGSLQTQECWPPYDYGPVMWREAEQ